MSDPTHDDRRVYQALPRKPHGRNESTIWGAFKRWIGSSGVSLGERVGEAEVQKREHEAERLRWEAQKKKVETLDDFFTLASKIFLSNEPEELKQLKLAAVFSAYPEFERKFQEIRASWEFLRQKGASIAISAGDDGSPSEPDAAATGQ